MCWAGDINFIISAGAFRTSPKRNTGSLQQESHKFGNCPCHRRVTNLGIVPVTGESQVWELSESHKFWNCPCHKRVTNLGIAPVTGKSQICDRFITVSAKCCDLSFQRESHVAQCHTLRTNVIMLVINSNSVSFFLRVTLVQDIQREY